VSIPVFGLGQCLINAIVEVLVVGEDDMATNIVELGVKTLDSSRVNWGWQTHEAFRSDIRRGKTTRGLV
jgi:hypothetical protein